MPHIFGRRFIPRMKKHKKSDKYKKEYVPVSKGKIIELDIIDISDKGDGIGKINKFAVFVPDTKIGERVKVKITEIKKNCAVGKRVN